MLIDDNDDILNKLKIKPKGNILEDNIEDMILNVQPKTKKDIIHITIT